MKHYSSLLLAVGYIAASLLGGLLVIALIPAPAAASPLHSYGLPVVLTALDVPYTGFLLESNGVPQLIDTYGSFEVNNSASLIEVSYQATIRLAGYASGRVFQLRLDNQIPMDNTGEMFVTDLTPDFSFPCSFDGYWQNIPAGTHSVSLWVIPDGSNPGDNGYINPGNHQGNNLIIKEYLPFGTTHLPSIQR